MPFLQFICDCLVENQNTGYQYMKKEKGLKFSLYYLKLLNFDICYIFGIFTPLMLVNYFIFFLIINKAPR